MTELTSEQHGPALQPFNNIALTFSGGGFRAASFSLGALAYLRSIKTSIGSDPGETDHRLLDNVSYISSASGGSFTNAMYSAYLHQGKTFEQAYKKLYWGMQGEKVLEEVFRVLNDASEWDGTESRKSRNIINAFARVYDNMLFEGVTFNVYRNKDHQKAFEVCFNTTEFYRGQSFRFATDGTDNSYEVTGNKYLHFDTAKPGALRKIKIADMVASSSCFPAGFEPIIFPEDFTYDRTGNKLTVNELKESMIQENYKEEKYPLADSFGLMDGGITDNQGLASAMLADNRRRGHKPGIGSQPFDTFIISDVTSYFMNEYKIPKAEETKAWSKKNLNWWTSRLKLIFRRIPLLLILTLAIGIGLFVWREEALWKYTGIAIGSISGILLILYLVLTNTGIYKGISGLLGTEKDTLSYLKIHVPALSKFTEPILTGMIRFFGSTKLGGMQQMIKARLGSLLTLSMDVNLKQIRRLIYDGFYNNGQWNNRRVPNFIYELNSNNRTSRRNRFNDPHRLKWQATEEDKLLFLDGCEKMNVVAQEATMMGTTLWFDSANEDKLKKIIACGQFSTCCNMLEYIVSMERKGVVFDPAIQEELNNVKTTLINDWNRFKVDPFYLFDEMGV